MLEQLHSIVPAASAIGNSLFYLEHETMVPRSPEVERLQAVAAFSAVKDETLCQIEANLQVWSLSRDRRRKV